MKNIPPLVKYLLENRYTCQVEFAVNHSNSEDGWWLSGRYDVSRNEKIKFHLKENGYIEIKTKRNKNSLAWNRRRISIELFSEELFLPSVWYRKIQRAKDKKYTLSRQEREPVMSMSDRVLSFSFLKTPKEREANTNVLNAQKIKALLYPWMLKKFSDAVIVPEVRFGADKECQSEHSKVTQWAVVADFVAFGTKEVDIFEIKAENDTFARLDIQIASYSKVADRVWLVLPDNKKAPKMLADNVGVLVTNGKKIKILKTAKKIIHTGSNSHLRLSDQPWKIHFMMSISGIKGSSKLAKQSTDKIIEFIESVIGKENMFDLCVRLTRRIFESEHAHRKRLFEKQPFAAANERRQPNYYNESVGRYPNIFIDYSIDKDLRYENREGTNKPDGTKLKKVSLLDIFEEYKQKR